MTDDIIPQDIKKFIFSYIDSVAQLEGLLIFHSNPDKAWDADMLAAVLYIHEQNADLLLAHLTAQGFITSSGNTTHVFYRYAPQSAELTDLVNRTADLYRRCLVPVTNLIHSKSKARIQEFANAFRIRKD